MIMVDGYRNREHAGRKLAQALQRYARRNDVIVLGLPRGGVPVAAEIAEALNVPLDIFVVRKLGVPGHEELAMGAIASGGARVLSHDLIDYLNIPPEMIVAAIEKESRELSRREFAYRGNKPHPDLTGKTVILVDDGLATGSTMKAAVQGIQQAQPRKVVVAVPVGSDEACAEFAHLVDDVICLLTPPNFRAVGLWYEEFGQTSDDEVRMLLQEADNRLTAA
jgi:putative phosphoribosyl transferase